MKGEELVLEKQESYQSVQSRQSHQSHQIKELKISKETSTYDLVQLISTSMNTDQVKYSQEDDFRQPDMKVIIPSELLFEQHL